MLFDPRPKKSREELFDREKEINALVNSKEPLTLLLGLRRVGKSSLLRVALNEVENGIYIDARKMYFDSGGWITVESLKREFEKSLNSLKGPIREHLSRVLKKVKGVSVSGLSFTLENDASLSEVLAGLNEIGAMIGIDEAQYLRFYGARGGREFLALLACAYDNLENIRFVLTGSEVGLLHDFLALENYESPLYGRSYEEVILKPFPRELSIEFLRQGFFEVGMTVSDEIIMRAVDYIDGIPGWLVEFGRSYLRTGDFDKAIENVLKTARGFVRGELGELEKRSPRYPVILKAIAHGFDRWNLIRDYLLSKGTRVPNSRLANLLRNLEKMSWIEKDFSSGEKRYRIVDPVIERVLRDQ
ncbi:AAA family ATPase [Thermococcus siculi]|uniref:AAA family ATPase n=1 Tax=Thermococcus siculi TaxID=72803 RepID=A0A2Z2MK54_9EURY|nr:ATP-binding protein [Thermococcus siculi]ASJ08005.1 AAA family ATPase [Thermococcus siculi]